MKIKMIFGDASLYLAKRCEIRKLPKKRPWETTDHLRSIRDTLNVGQGFRGSISTRREGFPSYTLEVKIKGPSSFNAYIELMDDGINVRKKIFLKKRGPFVLETSNANRSQL